MDLPRKNEEENIPIAYPLHFTGPAPYMMAFEGSGFGVVFELEFRQRLPNLTRGQVGDFSVIQSYLNGLCGGFCR
jgi:hypothetical protein